MAREIVGIDASGDSLNCVEILTSAKKVVVKRLSEASSAESMHGKVVATGLMMDRVLFRETMIPFGDKKRVKNTLPFLLSESLPFPFDDASCCYFTRNEKGDKGVVTSFLIRKEHLDLFRKNLEERTLRPDYISLESSALARVLSPPSSGSRRFVSLHMTENRTLLTLVEDRQPIFFRNLNSNLLSLLSGISDTMGIAKYDAEKILFSSLETDYDEGTKNAMDSAFAPMLGEILLTLKAIKGEDSLPFAVSGKGMESDYILKALKERIGGIYKADIDKDIAVDSSVKRGELLKKGLAPLGYAILCLEKSEMNFLSKSLDIRSLPAYKKIYTHRRNLFRSSIILLSIYLASTTIEVLALQSRMAEIKKQTLKVFSETLPSVKRIVNERHQLKTALDEVEAKSSVLVKGKGPGMMELLNELTSRSPEKVALRITRLQADRNTVKLFAETSDFDGVEKVKRAFSASPLFASVEVGGAKASKLQDVVEFQLNMLLNK